MDISYRACVLYAFDTFTLGDIRNKTSIEL